MKFFSFLLQMSIASAFLQGIWQTPHARFIWQSVKMFKRRSSEHEHDYWIVSSSGACLASQAEYAAARFDVDSGTLQFTSRANARMDGPWKLFVSPLNPSRNGNETTVMAFFTQAGLEWLQRKKPHLAEKAWIDPSANEELMLLIRDRNGSIFIDFTFVLAFQPERTMEAIQDETLPHGARAHPSLLLAIDDNNLVNGTRQANPPRTISWEPTLT
jgi:hypothetical protein